MPLTNAEKQKRARAKRDAKLKRWLAALEDIANNRTPYPQAAAWIALNPDSGS